GGGVTDAREAADGEGVDEPHAATTTARSRAPGRRSERVMRELVGRQPGAAAPRSNQIRSPVNRRATGSHGKRIRTSRSTGSPDGGTPAHGPRFVPVSRAASNTPCGPTTISVSANRLSGNAANSSV